MDDTRKATGARQDRGSLRASRQGHLDACWADWFDGLTLTHASHGSTAIHGAVADQSALHGLLQ